MEHIKQIAAQLKDCGLDAMLLTSAPGEFYAVQFQGEGTVLVTEKESIYITDSRYIEAAKRRIKDARVEMTERGNTLTEILRTRLDCLHVETLGFEEAYMTVAQHELLRQKLPPCQWIPAQKLVNGLRAAKDPEELQAMRRAQEITEQAFSEILTFIKPGMTEREVEARLVYDMLRFGAEDCAFETIVASGPNGSMPHAVPTDRQIREGDFITMDFGAKWHGYCADMTRTVAMGEPTREMRKVYDIVLQAQLAGIREARAGIPGSQIDGAARQVIEQAGYGEYFGHAFGHSLGVEIHEGPNASPADERIMPVGAVVSAEPGIYLPGRFGVRIEDVVVMQPDGAEVLTRAPKELIVLR